MVKNFGRNKEGVLIMRSLFAFLICIAFVTTSISPIEAKIIRVPEDYQEIWAAARFAEGGDIVQVAPGVYKEESSIAIRPSFMKNPDAITLQGAGAKTTTIIGSIVIEDGGVEQPFKQPFKIDGFLIKGSIYADINVHRASIIISHNFITSSLLNQQDRGIRLRYKSFHRIRIEENIIRSKSVGISCEGNDSINGLIADVLIENNIIENNETGISCNKTSPKIRGNRIVGNRRGLDISDSMDYITNPDLGTRSYPGRNTIYKNKEYDIQNCTDEIIRAEYNYWGDAGGPERGGVIFLDCEYRRNHDWIDYKPWLHKNEAAYSVQRQRKLTSMWGQIKDNQR